MKPVSAFDNYPPFATNGARTMNTESAKYSVGFVPADTFPAEWANYLFHGATKGVSDLNTALTSVWSEAQCVITCAGMTPDSSCGNQLATAIQTLINNAILGASETVINAAKLAAHPVGSLYWSSDPTDPSQLFGGTWTAVKDKFVWAKGDSDTVNATSGEKTHTLTVAEMPSHNHGGSTGNSSPSTNAVSLTTGNMSANSTGWAAVGDRNLNGYNRATGPFKYRPYVSGINRQYAPSSDVDDYSLCIDVQHTHSINGHSHTVNSHSHSISAQGSSGAHNNMPPYIVKYCWERIA